MHKYKQTIFTPGNSPEIFAPNNPPPNLAQAKAPPSIDYQRKEYEEKVQANNERQWMNAGYNRDGSMTPMMNLQRNKYWGNFEKNLAIPMFEGYSLVSGAWEIRTVLKGAKFISFFSVQTESEAIRLAKGGWPWPSAPTKAHLGEGLYTWGTKAEAKSYLDALSKNNPSLNLKILEFKIPEAQLSSLKTFKVPTNNVGDQWLSTHSTLYGNGIPHGYQYIQGNTNFGTEHFFSKDIFRLFNFSTIP